MKSYIRKLSDRQTYKMHISNLPVEIQCNIREYGYNPLVSDKDLYRMIRDLNPRFSLISIYDRLVSWNTLVNDKRSSKTLYERYIKDKDVETIGPNCGTIGIAYANGTNINDRYMGSSTYISTENVNRLIDYIGNLRSDPINPTYVFKRYNMCPSLEQIYYLHTYVKNRPSVYDYSDELHDLIKELYPSFSLQKEYQKLSIRKKYSDMLDDKYKRLLTNIDEYLLEIEYDTNQHRITLYIDYSYDIKINSIELYGTMNNIRREVNNLIISCIDHETFVSFIAFISNDVYIKEYIMISNGYKVPFQSNIIF